MEYQKGDNGISGVGCWNPKGKLVESQEWGCSRVLKDGVVESQGMVMQSQG